jgi:hypothetical protein
VAEALKDFFSPALARGSPRRSAAFIRSFRRRPHVLFVADHGLDHFDPSLDARFELTKTVLEMLAPLKDDPATVVRRSVANIGELPPVSS